MVLIFLRVSTTPRRGRGRALGRGRRGARADLVAPREQRARQGRGDEERGKRQREAPAQRDGRAAEEAVAEAVDEVKAGVHQRERAPRLGQRVDPVEYAAQERERYHHEALEARQLLEASRPERRDQAERAEQRAPQDGEGDDDGGVVRG